MRRNRSSSRQWGLRGPWHDMQIAELSTRRWQTPFGNCCDTCARLARHRASLSGSRACRERKNASCTNVNSTHRDSKSALAYGNGPSPLQDGQSRPPLDSIHPGDLTIHTWTAAVHKPWRPPRLPIHPTSVPTPDGTSCSELSSYFTDRPNRHMRHTLPVASCSFWSQDSWDRPTPPERQSGRSPALAARLHAGCQCLRSTTAATLSS